MSDQIRTLLEKSKSNDFKALARLLTLVERQGGASLENSDILEPSSMALRLGITGPPGAGKSTLIGQLIAELRARDLKVGVIAVDPSSPFSKGAILADRIRYSEHFGDDQVFIRSLGTRGSLGGLSASTYLMVRVFDACGFDVVLIETVGVGQTELEIMHVADRVAVTLVPESGDSVQAMKAGLLEISDLFVVNKADRPGAEGLVNELKASMSLPGASRPVKVLKTVATENQGVKELTDELMSEASGEEWRQKRYSSERLQAEAQALLRQSWERDLEAKAAKVQTLKDLQELMRS